MTRIAMIPARSGSRRIKNKNIRPFFGMPIMAYSIRTALKSGLFDQVFVSSDSDEYLEIAAKYGAVRHYRSAAMAENAVGTYEVTKSFAEDLELDAEDIVCCTYATAPMMSADDLKTGAMYMDSLPVAHAISIGYPPLQDAAQFYFSRVGSFHLGVPYFDVSTALVPVSNDRIRDINTPRDWMVAEEMYKQLQKGNS